MTVDVVVLNGGSSSGKTTLAVALQQRLPEPFLRLGVDTLLDALPADSNAQIAVDPDGVVTAHPGFRRIEQAWNAGLKAIAAHGVGLIVEDVFLGGVNSQQRLAAAFAPLTVVWVGVRCAAPVAAAREAMRGDRAVGMAIDQAERAHLGVTYDLEVDTTERSIAGCADEVTSFLISRIAQP